MSINLISGENLKILLKRKGITQKEIIEKFGLHQTTVSRYLTGSMQMPASFILKVAKYANLSINDLIEGDIDPHTIDIEYNEIHDTASLVAEPLPTYSKAAPIYDDEEPVIDTSSIITKLDELSGVVDFIKTKIDDIKRDVNPK